MKAPFAIAFVLITVLFIKLSVAQSKAPVKNCRYYDSMASVRLFGRDTIGAMEHYQASLKLDPGNKIAKKNLEKLTNYYIKAGQSFYHIDP